MILIESAAYKYIFIFLIGYVFSWALTPLIRKWALSLGVVDMPGERRPHLQPTPRCGGVAVFIAFHLSCYVAFVTVGPLGLTSEGSLLDFQWWLLLLSSSFVLLLIGLYDDFKELGAVIKLLGQIVAAAIMFFFGVRFGGVFGFELSPFFDFLTTIIWHVAIINAFNLIDGHDGVATGLAAIAALGIGGTFIYRNLPLEALLLCGFIGACLGFLRHNYPPASIFLGDSGSMFLGFTLASITLSTSSKGTGLAALWVPLFALGVPIFDTMLAIVRRSGRVLLDAIEGNPNEGGVMSADIEHVHHRLVQQGFSARTVTSILYIANISLVFVGMLSLIWRDSALGMFLVLFIVGAFITLRHIAQKEVLQVSTVLVEINSHAHLRRAATLVYLFFDSVVIVLLLIFYDTLITYFFLPHWLIALSNPLLLVAVSLSALIVLFLPPYRSYLSQQELSVVGKRALLLSAWLFPLLGILFVRRYGTSDIYGTLLLFLGITTQALLLVRFFPQKILRSTLSKKTS